MNNDNPDTEYKNMKTVKRTFHLCLWLTVMGVGLVFSSFMPDNTCIDEVRSIYKNMKMDDLENGSVYINYTQTTHFKKKDPSDPEQSKTTVECIFAKNQVHYKSNEIAIYMDSVDNFTVIPIRKMVFWSNSTMNKGREKRVKDYNLIQDSLFAVSKVIACKQLSETTDGYNKVVTITPEKRAQGLFKYEDVTFYINTKTQQVKKVHITFLPKLDYTGIDIVYNKIELNYQKENMKTPVKRLFVAADNKLKGGYKDYKLIDNRVKDVKTN